MLSIVKDKENNYIIVVTTEKEYECHKNTNFKYIRRINLSQDKEEIRSILEELNLIDKIKKYNNLELNELRKKAIKIIENRETTIDIVNDICKENTSIKDNIIFGLYNADSYISENTLKWIQDKREKLKGRSVIFQQYGDYSGNINEIEQNNFISKSILLISSMWQNRWSLGFEIANALKQFNKSKDYGYVHNQKLNYCIGHGLFFDYKTFVKFNGFCEITYNEDAIWGLQASYLKIPIIPIPIMEAADIPTTVTSLYKQKTTWYYGPIQSFNYYKIIIKIFEIENKKEKVKLFLLSLSLFEHAVRWVVVPLLMILMFILSVGYISKFILTYIIMIIYISVPNFMVDKYLHQENKIDFNYKDKLVFKAPWDEVKYGETLKTLIMTCVQWGMQLNGLFMIHASCVAKDDKAVLLFGGSGAGKTSLAIKLCKNYDFSFLSNGSTIIKLENDKISCLGALKKGIKLRYSCYVRIDKKDADRVFYDIRKAKDNDFDCKKQVMARELGLKEIDEKTNVYRLYTVNAQDGNVKNVDIDPYRMRLTLYQDLARFIRCSSTYLICGKDLNKSVWIPNMDTKEIHNKRKEIIEILVSDGIRGQALYGNVPSTAEWLNNDIN